MYSIYTTETESSDTVKIDGKFVHLVDRLPDKPDGQASCIGWMTGKKAEKQEEGKTYASIDFSAHEIHTGKPSKLLYRRKGYFAVKNENGTDEYAAYYTNSPLIPILLRLAWSAPL